MNRSFTVECTPARARLLVLMHKHTDFELDPAIVERAEQDRISIADFGKAAVYDPIERAAVQFILDTNFRAGIPTEDKTRDSSTRILNAAILLGGIEEDDVVAVNTRSSRFSASNYLKDYQFDNLLPHRRKLLVLAIDDFDASMAGDLVGKMFPRIIAIGSMTVQYSFSFGSSESTTSKMGKMLYPAVEEAVKRSPWKKNQRRSVLSMGVFPDLLSDFNDHPKKMAKSFLPTSVQY